MYKIILLITVLMCQNLALSAKDDSTAVELSRGFENNDIALLAELMDVTKYSVVFNDAKLLGKHFMFSIDEYKDGNLLSSNPFFKCGKRKIEIDSQEIELPDPCDNLIYTEDMQNFKINFILKKVNNDTTLFKVLFPTTITYNKYLVSQGNEKLVFTFLFIDKIPLNEKIPFMVISSGFHFNKSLTSYCMLLTKPVDQFYKSFGMKHYYVVYLEMK